MVGLFVAGIAAGWAIHGRTQPAPLASYATLPSAQPPAVVTKLGDALLANDADRLGTVVTGDALAALAKAIQDFSQVTEVEYVGSATIDQGTASAIVIHGRGSSGESLTINLVVQSSGGEIQGFR
jgi:hypothetical protein